MVKAITDRFSYKWQVLLVVMIGTFMAVLDSSIVNVSLPSMMADFGSSVDDIEWVVTGYMLSFSTFMPLTGWFRDHIGHKILYISSLVLFTLGSLACGLAWNLPSLVVARIVQALGAGAISPTGMSMISEVFEPKERGRALGYWGLGIIMGPAIGPTLGGMLTRAFGWRSIFTINLPIGLIGVFLAMSLLKHDVPHVSHRRPFDFWGFLFLSVFLVAFLLGLSKGEQEGWTSVYIFTCFSLAVLGFVGFLLVESLVPKGIIDLSLFKSPVFSVCMLVNAVRSVALFGSMFLLPVFLQRLMGYDAVMTGLILLPSALSMAVLIPVVGKLSDRIGPRWPSLAGLLIVAWFMFVYRDLNLNTRLIDIIWPTMLRSLGLVLLMAPIMTAALNAAPRHKAATVSSLSNLIQQVGGSLGIAMLTTMLTIRTKFHMSNLGSVVQLGPSAREFLFRMSGQALQAGYTHGQARSVANGFLARHVMETASVSGFQDTFLFGMVIMLAAVVPALLLPKQVVMHPEQGTHATSTE
jgi:MFS transporter, DHA2 family, multidrug resistance protein